ncbi:hypothetical protein BB560_007042 [Smittium megazygosporum]|uniref:FHF complex subunit HOOK-interacting protein C-terminal domain-containing protein n=1 Tax=Smittium megazygosporum TaxID=133381 RepID=A0A2T9XZB9_9FUNG|nr:hypothetical protein BB560_007042 [Smittium megazygosporum]
MFDQHGFYKNEASPSPSTDPVAPPKDKNGKENFVSMMKNIVLTAGEMLSDTFNPNTGLERCWLAILEFYDKNPLSKKILIENTLIPSKISDILDCLIKTWFEPLSTSNPENQNASTKGKSVKKRIESTLEFLENENVLFTLVNLAHLNSPNGMQYLIVRFFRNLVEISPIDFLLNPKFKQALALLIYSVYISPEYSIYTNSLSNVPFLITQKYQKSNINSTNNFSLIPDPYLSSSTLPINPPLASASKVWKSCLSSLPSSTNINEYNLSYDVVKIIHSLLIRTKEHCDLFSKYFLFFVLNLDNFKEVVPTFIKPSDKKNSLLEPQSFYTWMLFLHLMIPGAAGEVAREALVILSQNILLNNDNNSSNPLVGDGFIIDALIESIGYLYSQVPISKPAHRSRNCRVFQTIMMGPRVMSIPARVLHEDSVKVSNNINPLESNEISSQNQTFGNSKYFPIQNNFLDSENFLISESISSKPIKTIDIFYLCWELLDEISICAKNNPATCDEISFRLNSSFLSSSLLPSLETRNKSEAFTNTIYITELVRITHSEALKRPLYNLLLGETYYPEKIPHIASESNLNSLDSNNFSGLEKKSKKSDGNTDAFHIPGMSSINEINVEAKGLRSLLINRIIDVDDKLSLSTLRLLDALLMTLDQHIYTNLVLKNFVTIEEQQPNPIAHLEGSAPIINSEPETHNDSIQVYLNSANIDYKLARAITKHFISVSPQNIKRFLPEAFNAAALKYNKKSSKNSSAASLSKTAIESEYSASEAQSNTLENSLDHSENAPSLFISKELSSEEELTEYISINTEKIDFINNFKRKKWNQQSSNNMIYYKGLQFYPGDFMSTLFKSLKLMFNRHIALNVVTTSILARLVLIGNSDLTTFLLLQNQAMMEESDEEFDNRLSSSLKPGLELKYSCQYLYDILVVLSAQAAVKASKIADFEKRKASLKQKGVLGSFLYKKSDYSSSKHGISTSRNQNPSDSSRSNNLRDKEELIESGYKSGYNELGEATASNPNLYNNDSDDSAQDDTKNSSKQHKDMVKKGSLSEYKGNASASDTNKNQGSKKRFLNAYLVLEEFCKELGAISLAYANINLDNEFAALQLRQYNELD